MNPTDPHELEQELNHALDEAAGTHPESSLRSLEITAERVDRYNVGGYRLEAVFATGSAPNPERVELHSLSGELARADTEHWELIDRWARKTAERLHIPFNVRLTGD